MLCRSVMQLYCPSGGEEGEGWGSNSLDAILKLCVCVEKVEVKVSIAVSVKVGGVSLGMKAQVSFGGLQSSTVRCGSGVSVSGGERGGEGWKRRGQSGLYMLKPYAAGWTG